MERKLVLVGTQTSEKEWICEDQAQLSLMMTTVLLERQHII
jgi:hypothetical protein